MDMLGRTAVPETRAAAVSFHGARVESQVMDRRARWKASLTLVVCVVVSLPRDVAGQGGYVSTFAIGLEPDIAAWTSDFPARRTAIEANASPARADWYAAGTIYSGSTFPYGPLNQG